MLLDILFATNLTAEQAIIYFIIKLVVFVFSLVVHEFSHAFMAYKMGDPTAKMAGRLTLNPLKHIDGTGIVIFLLLGIGWAKPVPTNPVRFKKYRKGIRFVSIAGVTSNIIIGVVCAGIFATLKATVGNPTTNMDYVYYVLEYGMIINSYLALFNLIPIYPLDGFNFVTSFMKSQNKFIYFSLKNGFKIVLGVLCACLIADVMFNINLLEWYLSLLYNWVFKPIAELGV